MTPVLHHEHLTRTQPPFFVDVQRRTTERWKQLESDPELAGPWRQLFSQVQSPRHVVSELLQNADDAGARHVSARIENHEFIFEHDGADFSESDFASLCRFGFSNKRSLHTIGFRGIGFKSTFSLGECVDVWTPTLAFRFRENRFTLPEWMPSAPPVTRTTIRVHVHDENRESELRRNLDEWAASTASLLFFRSVRALHIGSQEVAIHTIGPGPIPNSEWIHFRGAAEHRLLRIRSVVEPFPPGAVDEIRQERNSDDLNLPPCQVEIVLGLPAPQRLFVVLPTGVRPPLPFSCNAPFLQDPARVAIKDPAISTTNRWLLQRLGQLAAETMLHWLGSSGLSLPERARAYDLLPAETAPEGDIEGACATSIRSPFRTISNHASILLTADGKLTWASSCICPPLPLYSAWDREQLVSIFGVPGKHILAEEVSEKHRTLLTSWNLLTRLTENDVVIRLSNGERPPRPLDWFGLLQLWKFIQGVRINATKLRQVEMVPVEGSDRLLSATAVVRLAAGRGLGREDDARFLASLVHPMDRDWIEFLSKDWTGSPHRNLVQSAIELQRNLELESYSVWDKVIAIASRTLFNSSRNATADDAVRLTHIAAALNTRIPDDFQFLTRDGKLRAPADGVIHGGDGTHEELFPPDWYESHVLHPAYTSKFDSCSRVLWREWIRSEKSRISAFAPLTSRRESLGIRQFENEFLSGRHVDPPSSYPSKIYAITKFIIEDHDFAEPLWTHWQSIHKSDPLVWCQVIGLIKECGVSVWSSRSRARALQSGYGQYAKEVPCNPIPARWIIRLQSLCCLPDTYKHQRQPAELLMRSPQTEPLMGVEPFVQAEFDTEEMKPLLRMLGVRDNPTGVENLLNRIRALATVKKPLPYVQELAKWYGALDKVLPRCNPEETKTAQHAFRNERLILSDPGEWFLADEIFQQADDLEMPEVPVIHAGTRNLAMWTRLGVAERPTLDCILGWLHHVDSDKPLDTVSSQRVRAALKSYPTQVWGATGHWLSLENTWTAVEKISFRLTMRGLIKWSDLFPAIKLRTGNFQMLSAETCDQPPFSALPDLGSIIEFRPTGIDHGDLATLPKPWIATFAAGLSRVILPDPDQTARIRVLAHRLGQTTWQPCRAIRISPFIQGVPAGVPHSLDVLWHQQDLFVRNGRLVTMFNAVVNELARAFGNDQIADGIKACIERDADFINEYLNAHFELAFDRLGIDPTGSNGKVAVDEPSSAEPSAIASDPHEPQNTDSDSAPILLEVGADGPERKARNRELRKDPTLITMFAAARGFKWDPTDRGFVHLDGSQLSKCNGVFHWQRYDGSGIVTGRYWVSEQSLDDRGLEIPAELWELICMKPHENGLIVLDNESPTEIMGAQLLAMKERGLISLFPAKYRIRKSID